MISVHFIERRSQECRLPITGEKNKPVGTGRSARRDAYQPFRLLPILDHEGVQRRASLAIPRRVTDFIGN